MPLAFYDILYYALLAFGPFVTDNYFERFRSMERNAVENETFFLALASVWPHAPGGLPEEWATTALLTFTYIRFVHFVLYCFIQVQPWRAIAWTVGALVVLSIAVNILFGFA